MLDLERLATYVLGGKGASRDSQYVALKRLSDAS